MSFSPNLFLSNVRAKDGLARPCRYEVILPIPPYINQFVGNSVLEKILNFPNSIIGDVTDAVSSFFSKSPADEYSQTSNSTTTRYLALQCENAELPGRTLLTQEAKVYGPTYKVPYQSQYNDATLSFICTNQFYERKLFDRWLEAIHPSDTNNIRFPKGSASRYLTNIKIIQYDDFIKQIFAVELLDAYPIGISAQQLSWGDDTYHRINVQFAYQRYKPIYEGTYDLAAAATALFGAGASRLLPFGRAL
jgi:hypothetical protein